MDPERRKVRTQDWPEVKAFAQKYNFSYFRMNQEVDPNNDLDHSNTDDFYDNIFKNEYYIHYESTDGDGDTYYVLRMDSFDGGIMNVEDMIFYIQLDHFDLLADVYQLLYKKCIIAGIITTK
jgi:hypothetical protein